MVLALVASTSKKWAYMCLVRALLARRFLLPHALGRITLPVPVILKRLAAALWVLSLGTVTNFQATRGKCSKSGAAEVHSRQHDAAQDARAWKDGSVKGFGRRQALAGAAGLAGILAAAWRTPAATA